MELFLNILWLLVALGLLGIWRARWVHQRRDARRNPLAECAALGCVLVMLFFAISLSDDLHLNVALCDEISTGRRHSGVWVSGHDSSHSGRVVSESGAAVLPRISPLEEPSQIARLISSRDAVPTAVEFGQNPGRGPPSPSA